MLRMLLTLDAIPVRAPFPFRVVEGRTFLAQTTEEGTWLLTLNDTGTAIWSLIDGHRSVRRIIQALQAGYAADAGETLVQETQAFVERLAQEQVITLADQPGASS